jgi:hypothetical protein
MAMESMRRFARDVMPAFARDRDSGEEKAPHAWESTLAW